MRDADGRAGATERLDPLLLPFLRAPDAAAAQRCVEDLLEGHARPIVREIVQRKVRRRAGWGDVIEAAADVEGDVIARLLARLRDLRNGADDTPIADFAAYAAVTAYHGCHRYVRALYPHRARLKNRVRYFLTRHASFDVWPGTAGMYVCGRRAWRGRAEDAAAAAALREMRDAPDDIGGRSDQGRARPAGGTPSSAAPSRGAPSGGAESGLAATGGARSGGPPSGGAASGGARSGGQSSGGAESGRARSGGPSWEGGPSGEADLANAILTRLTGPVDLDDLVGVIATRLGIVDAPPITSPASSSRAAAEGRASGWEARIEDPRPSVATALLDAERIRRLWREVLELPVRQRVALLLNLRDAHGENMTAWLPLTGVATMREIAAALEMPALDFAALWRELPLEDLRIAALLKLTRQQVINLRKCARERLARRWRTAS